MRPPRSTSNGTDIGPSNSVTGDSLSPLARSLLSLALGEPFDAGRLNEKCCVPPLDELAMQIAPFKKVVKERNEAEQAALEAKGGQSFFWMSRDEVRTFDGSNTVLLGLADGFGKEFFGKDCTHSGAPT